MSAMHGRANKDGMKQKCDVVITEASFESPISVLRPKHDCEPTNLLLPQSLGASHEQFQLLSRKIDAIFGKWALHVSGIGFDHSPVRG